MASQSSDVPRPTQGRVYFRDVKPCRVVDSLDELHGPAGGVVELSTRCCGHPTLWAPDAGRVDVDEPGGVALAYQAVLAEGTAEDLVHVLNRNRLVAAWPDLMLPDRVQEMWESRFLELRAATTPCARTPVVSEHSLS